MTKSTVTDTGVRWGLFRYKATSHAEDNCLLGKTYDSLVKAQNALIEFKKHIPMDLHKCIFIREIDN
jgi:hypothetical protein